MLTTDGSTAAFIAEHGFVDALVRVAMEEGVPPVDAYRMVTLTPATYYGKDGDLGGIAPGRYADLLLLRDLAEARPETVIARGRVAAREGRLLARVPEPPWGRIFTPRSARFDRRFRVDPAELALPAGPVPVIRLVSAVITALEERPLGPDDLHAALLDRRGAWLTRAGLAGLGARIDGLASTLTTDYEILAMGREPSAMARAIDRVVALRGGVVLVDGERIVFELPLPIGGIMSREPLATVAERERELTGLVRERGYAFHDFVFTMLFMTADFLPSVRLTSLGVWDVKRGRVLWPSRRRVPA
jgi:adenine deaminase